MTQVGYIGLGNMGGALARRLRLAYKIAVFALAEEAARRLSDAGAMACGSPAEVAAVSELIFPYDTGGSASAHRPTPAHRHF